MSKTKIISKGVCSYPQTEDFVKAKQFIIIEEDGKRYLLVKLSNLRSEKVTGVTLYVEQFEEGGRKISADKVRLKNICGYPKKSFAVEHKLIVADACFDCKITVLEAEFGGYTFTPADLEKPSYRIDPPAPVVSAAKAGAKGIKVEPRTLKMPALIITVSVLALVIAFAAIAVQTSIFTRNSDSFLQNGVRYRFENGDNSDGSDIYVVGYKGNFESVNIPEKIEGHRVAGISESAFAGNRKIKNVTIRGSIAVGASAFADCPSLKTINLENVTEIGAAAFYDCASLESVNIKRADKIGETAFKRCKSLKSVTVAQSDKPLIVGQNAFAECASLETADIGRDIEYERVGNYYIDIFADSMSLQELRLKNFESSDGVRTYTVHDLFGRDGKRESPSLRRLEIDTLDAIGAGFAEDIPVETVRIGYLADTEVGKRAFYGCGDLVSLVINEKLTGIENEAFHGCGIESLNASAVEYVGDNAFTDSGIADFDLTQNSVLGSIGAKAFAGSELASIYIPSSVDGISIGAFSGCERLTSVQFSEHCKLAFVSEDMFSGCSRLAEVVLPQSIRYIYGGAFADCKALASIELPQNLSVIYPRAFGGSGITSLYVPDGVESIGSGAFADCASLTLLDVPYIGGQSGRYNYIGYIFGATNYNDQSRFVSASLAHVTVRNARTVEYRAFYGCGDISRITLGEGLATIADEAFGNCANLTQIDLYDGLESIGARAFYGCGSLVALTVPKSAKFMGSGMLYGCASLKTLSLPFVGESENSYGTLAQMYGADYAELGTAAQSLEKISVTDATAIAEGALRGCVGLREVELCDRLESIGSYAFSDCRKLNTVRIPRAVTYIGDYAFLGCYRLYEVYNFSERYKTDIVAGKEYPGHVAYYALAVHGSATDRLTKVEQDGFEFVTSGGKWYLVGYPEGKDRIILPATVSAEGHAFSEYEIFDRLFFADGTVREIGVPQSVSRIGEYTFALCANLESISLSNGIREIGACAFAQCANLREVELPSGLTEIADGLFENCYRLHTVRLPVAFTRIGNRAFAECARLRAFDMSFAVTEIGDEAFYNCASLKRIVIPNSLADHGVGMFVGCHKLYDVCNLSRYTVRAGTSDLGDVARYAYKVFTDASSELPHTVERGVYYVYTDGWHAVDYYGTDAAVSVGTFDRAGTTVREITIDDHAFDGNEVAETAEIDVAVKSVGEYAFGNCPLLKSVEIETDALEIKSNAFFGSNIDSISITGGAVSLADGAFYNSRGALAFKFDGFAITVVSGAFSGSGLTAIDFKGSVFSASGAAFAYCTNLQEVKLDFAGDLAFEGHAFGRCENLASVSVRGKNISVRENAFLGATRLEKLDVTGSDVRFYGNALPTAPTDGITVTGNGAVAFDTDAVKGDIMNKLYVSGDKATFADGAVKVAVREVSVTSVGGATVGKSSIRNALDSFTVKAGGDITVASDAFLSCSVGKVALDGDTVTVGGRAFMNTAVSEVKITARTQAALSEYAFASNQCTKLEISAPTASIGGRAFAECALDTVTLDAENLTVSSYAFNACSDIQTLKMTAARSAAIGEYAFYGCNALRTLVLPTSLRRIENNTFAYCNNLRSLDIPSSVMYIGTNAFYGCNSLGSLVIPDGVSSVSASAFAECYNLVSLALPNRLVSIGKQAFYSCFALTSLKLPATLESIGENAFANCSALGSLEIPSSVTTLGIGAFSYCVSLRSLTLSAANIPAYAFTSCNSLTSLEIPSGVTSIGANAFGNCENLKTLVIANSVSSLGNSAFYGCRSLASVKLSDSLTRISDQAFYDCGKLAELELPHGLTTIGTNAFFNCSALKELTIPSTVTNLDGGAFSGCSALKSLSISGRISAIGANVFRDCTSLERIDLSKTSVTAIGQNAFYNCASLVELVLPDTLTSINQNAFYNCSRLTSLTIPQNVTANGINSAAFANSYRLFSIYNKSSRFSISANDSYGVAQYAMLVTTDRLYIPEFYTYEDMGFVKLKDEWYLYDYSTSETDVVLPDKAIIGGETVASYTVHTRALYFYCDSVVIPLSVKHVNANAFGHVFRVYYGGTAKQWSEWTAKYNIPYSYAYFYVDCIHESEHASQTVWMYKDGAPSIAGYAMGEWVMIKSPTCTAQGIMRRECPNCDYYETQTVNELGHEYADGKCVRCGQTDPNESEEQSNA